MPRNTRPNEKKCACPAKDTSTSRLVPVLAISTEGEAARLWRHALVGTRTCVALIRQYANLGMTNIPLNEIAGLRDQLSKIVNDHGSSAKS